MPKPWKLHVGKRDGRVQRNRCLLGGITMTPFIKSAACQCRVHCRDCRTDQTLRDGWRRVYTVPADFDTRCPLGVTLVHLPTPVSVVGTGTTIRPHIVKPSTPKLPSIPRLGYNFAKAVGRRAVAVAQGKPTEVSAEEQQRRLGLCGRCPLVLLPQWRCRHVNCGCWLRRKAKWATEDCPENCWKDPTRLEALQIRYRTEALPPEPPPEAEPADEPPKPPSIPPRPPPLSKPRPPPPNVVTMEDLLAKRAALTALLGEGQTMGTFRGLDNERGGCSGCRRRRYFEQLSKALMVDLQSRPAELLTKVRELFADREYIMINGAPTEWVKVPHG